MTRRDRRDETPTRKVNRPVRLNLRWEDLTPYGQQSAVNSGLKVHWKANELTATCGANLDILIWADEEKDAVSCQRCISGLEKQMELGDQV